MCHYGRLVDFLHKEKISSYLPISDQNSGQKNRMDGGILSFPNSVRWTNKRRFSV